MANLIPKPFNLQMLSGVYRLSKNAKIFSEISLPLISAVDSADNAEICIYKDSSLEKEEYMLIISTDGVKIKASCKNGAYYALQSLRMLARCDEGVFEAPCVKISDKPKYLWRGLHLDEARYFFGKEYVKKYLDEMFRLKLNIFHWHLTDDSGWRIEIKKYPLLTETGSIREYTQIGGWGSCKTDGKPYGGFYTQEDIKEIIEYASERCISIVPEIDVPAHFAAALAAYPHLACRNLKREVQGYYGNTIPFSKGIKDWNRPACMGKDEAIRFIMNVYEEVCDLFPFEYFHIGGDECDVSEWKACSDCQRVMKEKGFTNERELQLMLTNKLCAFLKSKGKHMIGWNEILRKDGIDKDAVAQYWEPKRDKKVEAYIKSGGKIIMSKHQAFYFDHPYAIRPLKSTYKFSPGKFRITKPDEKNILGVEGEMWTEWIPTREKLEFMLHPRMEALSEVAWTDESSRNFNEFLKRYENYKGIYRHLEMNYAIDKIAMPKNLFKRIKAAKLFHNGDPDYELKLNKELFKKGDR